MTIHQILRKFFGRVYGFSTNEQFEILQRATNTERPALTSIMSRTITDADNNIVAEGSSGSLSIVGQIEMGRGVKIPLSAIPVLGIDEHIDDALKSRIEDIDFNSTTTALFSMMNQVVGLYTRNPDCWAADIDTSCMVIKHSAHSTYNDIGGTLLTPGVVAIAWHTVLADGNSGYIKVGDYIRLVDMEGQHHDRPIVAIHRVTDSDLALAVVERDYPTSCRPAKVLPPDYADHIDLVGQPVIYTNKNRRAFIGQLGSHNVGFKTRNFGQSSDPALSPFWQLPEGGDSGSTVALVIDNQLVWVGHLAFVYAMSNWPDQYAELATKLASITDQKLRVFEFPKAQSFSTDGGGEEPGATVKFACIIGGTEETIDAVSLIDDEHTNLTNWAAIHDPNSAYNDTLNEITIPRSGVYIFHVDTYIFVGVIGDGGHGPIAKIYSAGGELLENVGLVPYPEMATYQRQGVAVRLLSAGQKIRLHYTQNSGADVSYTPTVNDRFAVLEH